MTERVWEDDRSFEVSGSGSSVEVYVFSGPERTVMITADEDDNWNSQRASFKITAEEATRLKEFLIRKGY